jgi:hypothetical protein
LEHDRIATPCAIKAIFLRAHVLDARQKDWGLPPTRAFWRLPTKLKLPIRAL